MTDGRTYRFETGKQLDLCLQMAVPQKLVLSATSGIEVMRLPLGVTDFAVSPEGEWAWIDAAGAVRRDETCAGPLVGHAIRMLFESGHIWVLSNQSLMCIDGSSLQLLGTMDGTAGADIASDGAGGVWLLTGIALKHLDCDGQERGEIKLEDEKTGVKLEGDSIAGAAKTIAVFSRSANQVTLIDGDSRLAVPLEKILGDELPRFAGERISSSGSGFLIEGEWQDSAGTFAGVLLLDSSGNPGGWGSWEDGLQPLHVLGAGRDLFLVVRDGQSLRLVKLQGAGNAGGRLLLTPPLESDTRPGDWLRANVRAILPEGATLALRWAATQDNWRRDAALQIAANKSLTIAARVAALRDLLDWSEQRTYVGQRTDPPDKPNEPQDFAFPLHEASGHFVWLELTILHSQDVDPPTLCSLAVHHDSPSLMDKLPAVYRTPDGDAGGVLRRLVAVLEATTQDLDDQIGKLADRLDPQSTDSRWLPSLVKLLGLPFDEALSTDQQRRLLQSAVAILAGRGTRRGVVALLRALFEREDWRVIDRTEQLAPITLGGRGAVGSPLPAFLFGVSERVPKLNARLVLGRTGLCAANACDELRMRRSPELVVEIAASPSEQRLYGSAVRQMIEAILPAGVRLRLRWMGPGSRTGETLTVLRDPRPLVLGDPTPIERVRLHGDRALRLRNELRMGHRLQ